MTTIHATYEAGVFRPKEQVTLPDPCDVEFEPRIVAPPPAGDALASVYGVLRERYASGETDVAARHDEHQPSPP